MVFKQVTGITMVFDSGIFGEINFLSLSMFKIVFLKNELELINTMLLVES